MLVMLASLKFTDKKSKARERPRSDQVSAAGFGFAPAPTRRLIPAFVFLATVVAFLPSLRNGFVDWDDYKTLVENQNYRGLGWTQLQWMFSTFYMGHYQPLSWVTFGVDYLLGGVEPFGYHLTNLFLHAVNAVLFYFVTLYLLSAGRGSPAASGEGPLRVAAGFGALLFAVHPLRVESVAWATERRDVLSGLFFLLTIFFYLRAAAVAEDNGARRRWLSAAVIVYVLSLLSKASGTVLPVVLLILDVYPLRRLGGGPGKWFGPEVRKVWLEKVPFAFLAVAFGIIALLAQEGAGALKAVEQYDVFSRLAQALYGLAFYLWKSVLPLGLSPLYELPVKLNPLAWPFLLSGFVVLAISVSLYLSRRTWPAGIAVWVYYAVVLFPVLGTAQSGPQLAADRYSYLSCLGWAILGGAGLRYCWGARFSGKIKRGKFIFASATAGVVVLVLGVLTWKQTTIWHDSEGLWRHALAVGQESSTVHYNLAYVLHKRGELAEAIEHYRKSLRFNPLSADAHDYLADALAEQGALAEAVEHYGQAIKINPYFWGAHYNLAIVLERQGKIGEAIVHYRQAVQINPALVEAYNNLGMVSLRREELGEAIEHFRTSLNLNPAQSQVYFYLGNILARQGNLVEAMQHYNEALRIKPDFAEAYHNLGRVLAARGDLDKAIDSFRRALEIRPGYGEAHMSLSQALAEQGKRDEAMRHYQEARRILESRPE
jgi:tetratricopeptide (TPR) repeat protein